MRREIKRLQRELEFTAVFVTHDQDEALSMSDRLLVLKDGLVQQIGTAKELYSQPANPFVCSFVGSSNQLGPAILSAMGLSSNSNFYIRPEDVKFSKLGSDASTLTAQISDIDYLGPTTLVDLNFGGEQFSALTVGSDQLGELAIGQEIGVSIDPTKILAFGRD